MSDYRCDRCGAIDDVDPMFGACRDAFACVDRVAAACRARVDAMLRVEGAAEERAAIVRWLRWHQRSAGCQSYADAIERGEHAHVEPLPPNRSEP